MARLSSWSRMKRSASGTRPSHRPSASTPTAPAVSQRFLNSRFGCGWSATSLTAAPPCKKSGEKPGKGNEKLSMTSRSEERTSELQSLMRISYAVFCLKKKTSTPLRETQQLKITTTMRETTLNTQRYTHDITLAY